jgi:anti-sigma regulatory factor (Ser/Thr protein kinase)
MCWDVTGRFPAHPRSPSAARQFCTQELTGLLASRPERGALLDDVALIVSELITNSLNAGSIDTTVTLSWHRHQLRLAVTDDAPGVPTLQTATRDESHGRGLAITKSLSSAWGVQPLAGDRAGKQVWAQLTVPTTLTEALQCRQ